MPDERLKFPRRLQFFSRFGFKCFIWNNDIFSVGLNIGRKLFLSFNYL